MSDWRICKVLTWNVRSIQSMEKLHKFLNYIEDHKADICCISETWFSSEKGVHTKAIRDAGYKIFHAFREEKRGGGVAIIYRQRLKLFNGEESTTQFSSFEYCYVRLKYRRQKMIILCLYRLGEVPCSTFCEEINPFIESLLNKPDVLLISGDFNIWAEEKKDKQAKMVFNLMTAFGFSQHVSSPTHIGGHTLDLVFFNKYQLRAEVNVVHDLLDFWTFQVILGAIFGRFWWWKIFFLFWKNF